MYELAHSTRYLQYSPLYAWQRSRIRVFELARLLVWWPALAFPTRAPFATRRSRREPCIARALRHRQRTIRQLCGRITYTNTDTYAFNLYTCTIRKRRAHACQCVVVCDYQIMHIRVLFNK